MEQTETLLERLESQILQLERTAADLKERVSDLEAMTARGMHPEGHEQAEDTAERTLRLARTSEQLQTIVDDLCNRVGELESAAGRTSAE